mmetsp:Transcript_13597/g.31410  ORF Transcript_13597/g.31410 Transcript_13597/m.31410 type:complete len:193 (+) Transcript_13597:377-955(+)
MPRDEASIFSKERRPAKTGNSKNPRGGKRPPCRALRHGEREKNERSFECLLAVVESAPRQCFALEIATRSRFEGTKGRLFPDPEARFGFFSRWPRSQDGSGSCDHLARGPVQINRWKLDTRIVQRNVDVVCVVPVSNARKNHRAVPCRTASYIASHRVASTPWFAPILNDYRCAASYSDRRRWTKENRRRSA